MCSSFIGACGQFSSSMHVYIKDFHYWFSMLSLGVLLFSSHKIIYGLVINMLFFFFLFISPPLFLIELA